MLPKDFTNRMQKMLGEEYEEFLKSCQKDRLHGLRINARKTGKNEFLEKSPFRLTDIPWARYGFYYPAEEQPGKHPYHEAGVYYIQEPSAMLPAVLLDAQPGERVLDLCAAPGGKTTQIADSMEGRGILVCNEIHPARAKILSENVERMGVRNAVVLNETPERLAGFFPDYFDRILVDAPCSGEGMFRKNIAAGEEWSAENVRLCAARQDAILESAQSMLRPGGTLVYSTCTFAPEENEGTVARFLKMHPGFSAAETEKQSGFCSGRPDWAGEAAEGLENTVRLWPHKIAGEGHYAAVLQKDGGCAHRAKYSGGKSLREKEYRPFLDFAKEYLNTSFEGTYLRFGDQLYLAPDQLPLLKGIRVLRPGLHLGTMKKERFEPSHALALAAKPEDVRLIFPLQSRSREIFYYLSGMTLAGGAGKGWHLVTVDGYSIGWGKLAGGTVKNHYPKGLRRNWKG